MKVGIYTIHADNNYGAMLQAYATQRAIESMGHDAEIVNVLSRSKERKLLQRGKPCSIKGFIQQILIWTMMPKARLKIRRFKDFHQNHLRLSKRYFSYEDFAANVPHYDVHLVGSDQTWNVENGIKSKLFFLDFLHYPQERRMSYAASFGTSKVKKEYLQDLKFHLSKFDSISVREQEGCNIIKSQLGLNATQVMDPTFLLKREEWEKLAGQEPLYEGKYIFAYGFGEKKSADNLIDYIKKKLGMPVVGVSVSYFSPFNYDYFFQEAGPIEFLNLISHAQFVITESFHGAAFAIHFRKPFLVFKHASRNSRISSMLSKIGLQDQMVEKTDFSSAPLSIKYDLVQSDIESASRESYDWFKENLSKGIGQSL